MSEFEDGDSVKFVGKESGNSVNDIFSTKGEHIIHGSTILGKFYDTEGAMVICYYEGYVAVRYIDDCDNDVCLNFREESLELFKKDELKNNKMDIEKVKKFDKSVIAEAKKKVLEVRAEKQTEEAVVVLTELFDKKDAIEEKVSEEQEELKAISKDIKVFDVKK